jgi:hypothetical protein
VFALFSPNQFSNLAALIPWYGACSLKGIRGNEALNSKGVNMRFGLLLLMLVGVCGTGFGQASNLSGSRPITFNGRSLEPQQLRALEMAERIGMFRLPDGKYWYDNRSGLLGAWGGPAIGGLPAGLGLGGALPANASGGGTGMFVNGRELHRLDVANLGGRALPGRYWLDPYGNFGYEGGPFVGNVFSARQESGGGQRRVYAPGEIGREGTVNAGGACFPGVGCAYPGQ